MPGECCLANFFTFLLRERNDGFGGIHALIGKINYTIPKAKLKTTLGPSYYKLPDVKGYRLNKYGLPSYMQLNLDVR